MRAYARYVGLDEEKMLAAYLAAAKVDGSPETDMQAMSSQVATARAGARDSSVNGTTVVGILALIVALGLGALWLREQRKEAREQAAASQASSAGGRQHAGSGTGDGGAVRRQLRRDAGHDPGCGGQCGAEPGPADVQLTTPAGTQSARARPRWSLRGMRAACAARQPGADQAAPVEVSISATTAGVDQRAQRRQDGGERDSGPGQARAAQPQLQGEGKADAGGGESGGADGDLQRKADGITGPGRTARDDYVYSAGDGEAVERQDCRSGSEAARRSRPFVFGGNVAPRKGSNLIGRSGPDWRVWRREDSSRCSE